MANSCYSVEGGRFDIPGSIVPLGTINKSYLTMINLNEGEGRRDRIVPDAKQISVARSEWKRVVN